MSYVNLEKYGKNSKVDPLTRGLREFKKKVKEAGIMEELKNRRYYMKPSEKKRFKRKESLRRRKREERKNK